VVSSEIAERSGTYRFGYCRAAVASTDDRLTKVVVGNVVETLKVSAKADGTKETDRIGDKGREER
jgi:hypothetical protein